MAQQTTIDWLLEEWPALKCQLPTWLIEQAKAMEKEQIVAARMNGMTDDELSYVNAEKYYNETYNK